MPVFSMIGSHAEATLDIGIKGKESSSCDALLKVVWVGFCVLVFFSGW